MDLVKVARELSRNLGSLEFSAPVTHVYDPSDYAWEAYREYLERFGCTPKQVLLLGMNPGPWGMAQTGVPFGDPTMVRDFLRIDAEVGRPPREHPKRPVLGLRSPRGEVSGRRLWGWVRQRFLTPQAFSTRFFVANYCPLCFMEASGRNRTPDKLPVAERRPLFEACDRALNETLQVLRPQLALGVGAFAEARLRRAARGLDLHTGRILHPSPASPLANRGWAAQAELQLQILGVELPGSAPSDT